MNYLEEYKKWCEDEYFNKEIREELLNIKENHEEIKDRFYKELEFGTAGLRGIIGAGTNRMNIYTVGKATQGLANFIIKEGTQSKGVAISYDSRHMSREFSEHTALCLNANGIKTYIFDSLRPVPELSFAVRQLGCTAGIMITASHNPAQYNGYKVYWDDGAQIVAPKDKKIIEEVRNISDYRQIKSMDKEKAIKSGLYNMIGSELDNKYLDTIEKLVLNPDIIRKEGKDIKIVYTPLHGTGNIPVRTILTRLGFENVYVVKEQELPDGDFPTVNYPNPEDKKAFGLAIKLAKEKNADLILATDPDADRLGVYAKDSKTGEYKAFTGNMSGLLIAEYELSQIKQMGKLPENGALVKTIVSSNLANAIARKYNVKLIEVLTGFKYIGEQMRIFDEQKNYEYLFGFEESYGCLLGTHARDKDAVVAVMALCEAAAYYKNEGLTLWDQMIRIYEEYGFYKEDLLSITLEGIDGAEKIKNILEDMRKTPLKELGGYKVIKFRDYSVGKIVDLQNGKDEKTELPKSNVLYYELSEDAWCCIRPSGTEPKIKFYIGVKENSMKEADKMLDVLKNEIKQIVKE